MLKLSPSQQIGLLDIIESVLDRTEITDDHLTDRAVVYSFLALSKELPYFVHEFLKLTSLPQWSQLTQDDILSEEVMLELHLMVGFSDYELSRWLHGVSFGGVQFFKGIASEQGMLNLDQIILNSRHNAYYVDGVLIDELPKAFEQLPKLVEYVRHQRISYKQYLTILAQLAPTPDVVMACAEDLVTQHHALNKITNASQLLTFRVFCGLFDFLDGQNAYVAGICKVFDQLLQSSTVEKTMQLMNMMPYVLITYMLKRFLAQGNRQVIDHLNEAIPQFKYGIIRKIVRREKIKLNYTYE